MIVHPIIPSSFVFLPNIVEEKIKEKRKIKRTKSLKL